MVKKTVRRNTIVGKKRGASIRDAPSWRWIKAVAKHFKNEGKLFVPNCTELIKSSFGRDRAPQNPDWYYIRTAAVLRRVYLRPGSGAGGLSKKYGIKQNRGSQPELATKGCRGLLRSCLQGLERMKLLEKGKNQGRVMTSSGRKLCDTIAHSVIAPKRK